MTKPSVKPPRKPTKKEIAFWNEPEWTLTSTLKRLFAWGMAALVVCIVCVCISEGKPPGKAIGALVLTRGYVYIEVKILLEKNRRNRAARILQRQQVEDTTTPVK